MPRVSEAHLVARRQQILEAAWRCFARNGFHATSMQDIFAESGLSAGAVYRYFPSKLELVKATAGTITEGVGEIFETIAHADPVPTPAQSLDMVVDTINRLTMAREPDLSKIAMHAWSEAIREPEVGAVVKEIASRIRQGWLDIVARWKAAGYIRTDVDPDDVAGFLYGVMVGYIAQRNLVGDISAEQYVNGFAALAHGRR
ncbi:TetR/AcrR family transcriptional regulator [Phytoactinopolyspora halotolerans]|uniref:TetR/AcrR family transcriptional regulator n=1 Tax=Phytoactinopolyspora halotolerans TaxID=1981512 RepID=A0A6L9S8W1_9ACTN|nr:TetR/AcrR family transcriptional regulator [Phytoactinopolyspora halotolerans]NEE00968.1 TetR/AcrR family transcriptional regulator [Phytoactinopolyspora halotolerans]